LRKERNVIDSPLDLPSLIVQSEQTTRLIFPSDSPASANSFYAAVQEEIDHYCLPLTCTPCEVSLQAGEPPHDWRSIGLAENHSPLLRVLVGIETMGNIGYIERKQLILTPVLPPPLDHNSPELPPRLTPQSPELPRPDAPYPANLPSTAVFKSESHKARVVKIEDRRWERYQKIQARHKERNDLMQQWLADALLFILHGAEDPHVRYLTASVDIVLGQIVKRYEESGAQARAEEERRRQEKELEEKARKIRSLF
jgi:hypothetical protein